MWMLITAQAYTLTGLDWSWQDEPLQIPFTVDYASFPPGFATEAELQQGIVDSLEVWNGSGADFFVDFEANASGDAIEVVYRERIGNPALAQAAIGGGFEGATSCEVRVYGSNTFGTIDWSFAPGETIGAQQADFRSVFIHEAGHCFGLEHSTVTDSVMGSAVFAGEVRRALTQDDIDGMVAMYGLAPELPTPPPTELPDDLDGKGCSTAGSPAWLGLFAIGFIRRRFAYKS